MNTIARLILALLILGSLPATAADKPAAKAKPKKKPNPVFAKIKDDPALPRVLLIGDSISIGYTLGVRKRLEGKANVHRPPTNCGPTLRGLEQIDAWLGDGKWDVIHFNWGLHDLKYMGPNSQNLADPKVGHQQVPPKAYEANLDLLVQRMKKTGAALIWRNTTPVPPGARGRVVGHAKQYNEIAARVMKKHGVRTHDLYAFVIPRMDTIMLKANVHFSKEGSQALAETVVKEIEAVLP
jgi:acyl-CoA thioesterase-1